MPPKFASVFLSHSSEDKRLVRSVATELGQLGVLPWVDVDRMRGGDVLNDRICAAIRRQACFVVFLSQASAGSEWVKREVEQVQKLGLKLIIPVLVDVDPAAAFRQQASLAEWVSKDQQRLAIDGRTLSASEIADKVAAAIYASLELDKGTGPAAIHLDQRGHGMRTGEPTDIPSKVEKLDVPILVFRHDRGPRTEYETLAGSQWSAYAQRVRRGLDIAFGQGRPRNVHVCGNAQLGLAWLLGVHFDKDGGAVLHCYNVRDQYNGGSTCFHNCKQPRQPEEGRTPRGDRHLLLTPIGKGEKHPQVALLLGPAKYVGPAKKHVEAALSDTPLVWIKVTDLESSKQVVELAGDVLRTLFDLRDQHDVDDVHILNCLPFHATPIIAHNMAKVLSNRAYREYRRDLEGRRPRVLALDMYEELTLPPLAEARGVTT